MSQQIINIGTAPGSKDGEPLYYGLQKANANFIELYGAIDALGTASVQDVAYFATSSQGEKADTAVQPGDLPEFGDLATLDVITVGLIDATGTANSSTFLRGDGTWAIPAGGGVGDLLAANNLSDLGDAAEARANLGLATVAATGAYADLSGLPTLGTAAAAATGDFSPAAHATATDNPHSVTKSQVGLSNVDNTSDADKPISTATQTALNGKASTVHSHTIADVSDLQDALDAASEPADPIYSFGDDWNDNRPPMDPSVWDTGRIVNPYESLSYGQVQRIKHIRPMLGGYVAVYQSAEEEGSTSEATSLMFTRDFITWYDFPQNPVWGKPQHLNQNWMDVRAMGEMMLWDEEDQQWVLFYVGKGAAYIPGNGIRAIGVATSKNMVDWTNYPSNPIIHPNSPSAIQNWAPAGKEIIRIYCRGALIHNGMYYMFVSAGWLHDTDTRRYRTGLLKASHWSGPWEAVPEPIFGAGIDEQGWESASPAMATPVQTPSGIYFPFSNSSNGAAGIAYNETGDIETGWVKNPLNPILPIGSVGSPTRGTPCLVRTRDGWAMLASRGRSQSDKGYDEDLVLFTPRISPLVLPEIFRDHNSDTQAHNGTFVRTADKATIAQAEAASNNTAWMTPLRVAQAYAALNGSDPPPPGEENTHSLAFGGTGHVATTTLGNFGSNLNGQWTVELWMRSTSTSAQVLLGTQVAGGLRFAIQINTQSTPGRINIPIRGVNGADRITNAQFSNLNDGNWHHIAIRKASGSAALSIVVDGSDLTVNQGTDGGPTFSDFPQPLYIGSTNSDGSPASPVSGSIDEVRIWTVRRTVQEITDNKDSHIDPNTADLFAYWKMNEGAGTSVADSCSNSHHGTITGASWSENVPF